MRRLRSLGVVFGILALATLPTGCRKGADESAGPAVPTVEEEKAKARETINEDNADQELERLKQEIESGG